MSDIKQESASVMTAVEPEQTSSFPEFEIRELERQKSTKTIRMVESARLGLTVLALLSAIVIVGTSAETLGVYNRTHLGQDYFLALWPTNFDIRPTIALITCGAIIVLASAISLATSKVPAIRSKPLIHTAVSFAAPLFCLIAGLIGTSFFYGVNASNTNFSLHGWSCQWSSVDMNIQPHWSTLCKESKAALYLTVMMIPLEVIALGAVAVESFLQKKISVAHGGKGSPALS